MSTSITDYQRNQIPGLGSVRIAHEYYSSVRKCEDLPSPQTHGAELANMYGPGDMTDFLVNFVNSCDPNGNTSSGALYWERYQTDNPVALDFYGNDSLQLMQDTYRQDAIDLVIKLSLEQPLPF